MKSKLSTTPVATLCCLLGLFINIQGSMGFLHCASSGSSIVQTNDRRKQHHDQHCISILGATKMERDNDSPDYLLQNNNRRALLSSTFLGFWLALTTMTMDSNPAFAKDELFKANPLTNRILEQVRILEQAEADELKYSGELEAGDAGNRGQVSAYPKLLAPIVQMNNELLEVNSLVHRVHDGNAPDMKAWKSALDILQNPKYDKVQFKKVFNAYGDNIYYSDPDRANLYLGGGATPSNEQSLAYLQRNEILTNLDNLRAELEYLLKSDDNDIEDLYKYADGATAAMKKYLALVPPKQMEEALKILSS